MVERGGSRFDAINCRVIWTDPFYDRLVRVHATSQCYDRGDDTLGLTGNLIHTTAYLDGDAADYMAQGIGLNRLTLLNNQFGSLATPNFS